MWSNNHNRDSISHIRFFGSHFNFVFLSSSFPFAPVSHCYLKSRKKEVWNGFCSWYFAVLNNYNNKQATRVAYSCIQFTYPTHHKTFIPSASIRAVCLRQLSLTTSFIYKLLLCAAYGSIRMCVCACLCIDPFPCKYVLRPDFSKRFAHIVLRRWRHCNKWTKHLLLTIIKIIIIIILSETSWRSWERETRTETTPQTKLEQRYRKIKHCWELDKFEIVHEMVFLKHKTARGPTAPRYIRHRFLSAVFFLFAPFIILYLWVRVSAHIGRTQWLMR